jgi:hypothetical protein
MKLQILTGTKPLCRMPNSLEADGLKKAQNRQSPNPYLQVLYVLKGLLPQWHDEDGKMLTDAPQLLLSWVEAMWDKNPGRRGHMIDRLGELDQMIRDIETRN